MGELKDRFCCDMCGASLDLNPSWRFNGENWEHRCAAHHPQAGHMGIMIPTWDFEHIAALEAENGQLRDELERLRALVPIFEGKLPPPEVSDDEMDG